MPIEQLGPYRVVRKIGRGGMGTVYEAANAETGEPAAVKILSGLLAEDEGFRERFDAEIETLRKVNHPGIVRLFGFGEQDGHVFYAMELVEGVSLEEELQRGRRFDWREVTGLAIEICRALRHAHDRGVIHRDLKPGNLLLSQDGRVKLSDFGIARLFGHSRLTTAGSVLGTAEYMAPEQAEGRPVDLRTDLYSLGGVLYTLLAGRPPFRAASLPEMLHMQRFAQPEPVGLYAPDAPQELQTIIARLLEKDPQKRFPNATVVARRLEAMLADLTVHPEPSVADAQSPASPDDFELTSPEAASKASNFEALPPTRVVEPAKSLPPAMDQPAAAAADLPRTKPTAAFKGVPPADKPDLHQQAAPPTTQRPRPTGRFTPVAEEDLDRIETTPPDHRALISLQTWVLAVSLIAVGLAVWYLLQPPSAEQLYDKISARIAGGGTDSLLDAENDIQQFLLRFPKDSRSDTLRKHNQEIQLHRLERKFERRAAGLLRSERLLPIERDYLEAIQYARLDPEQGMAKLQALVELYDHRTEASGPVGQCLELARRRLQRLREQVDEQAAQRLAIVQDRLDQAAELSKTDPAGARAMWQAVVELYAHKPWAAEAVRRAQAALAAPAASPDSRQVPADPNAPPTIDHDQQRP